MTRLAECTIGNPRRAVGGLAVATLSAAATLVLIGCGRPIRTWLPDVDHRELDSTAFLHYLSTVPWATVEEATRAVLLLADGEERFADHEDRLAELARRRAIKPVWIESGDQLLDRGTLAYMLRRVCRIPPSTNEIVLGRWGVGDRRYALKTCVDAGILSHGSGKKRVSGGELLGAISRADEYLERYSD